MKVVILGAGESGVGAAILAKLKYKEVFVSDGGLIKDHFKHELISNNIDFEEQQHTEANVLSADLVIKSPGIPEKATIVKKIREARIELISEIEFASRYTEAKIIAVTGSNGKTTTTSLIYHILKSAKKDVVVAGNIGNSFAREVANASNEYYVLEISSFQLDDINSFKPDIAIVTNVTEDHLDRYNYDIEEYVKAKFNITKHQNDTDVLIICSDDETSSKWMSANSTNAQVFSFSDHTRIEKGAYIHDSKIVFNVKKKDLKCQSKI